MLLATDDITLRSTKVTGGSSFLEELIGKNVQLQRYFMNYPLPPAGGEGGEEAAARNISVSIENWKLNPAHGIPPRLVKELYQLFGAAVRLRAGNSRKRNNGCRRKNGRQAGRAARKQQREIYRFRLKTGKRIDWWSEM